MNRAFYAESPKKSNKYETIPRYNDIKPRIDSRIPKKSLQSTKKSYYDPYPNYNTNGNRSYATPNKSKNKYEREAVQ